MPELPEVQTVVNSLTPRIKGARIRCVDLRRKDIVTPSGIDLSEKLVGEKIERIDRRGKRIVFLLEDGNRFYIHLGMSGRLTMEARNLEVLKHTHLIVDFEKMDVQMRFRDPRRFGGVFWLGDQAADEGVGIEPLDITAKQLAEKLKGTKRVIKTALLDQKMLAGLGNIYADEALHAAGIRPTKRADRLKGEEVRELTKAIKGVLRRALRHRGSTLRDYVDADGAEGGFQKLHRVYGREGKACLRCGGKIRRVVLGGRSTHFCGECQT
jgi:formamidopyrimidine-DNA glycosylase